MSFQPILPSTGLVGWRLLSRTMESQQNSLSQTAEISRDTEYFKANIAKVETAEQLVGDRRLLRVALGAFGLEADIDNRFFIKKILEEGTREPDALANKLADERYSRLSSAFGFDQFSGPNTYAPAFAKDVVDRFNRASFEIAVGNQDEDMRLALNVARELPELAVRDGSDNSRWFLVMGNPPMRKVFETALNLPSGFGKLDLDQQLGIFRDRAESRFGVGEVSGFADEGVRERLIEQFLMQSQLQQSASYSGMSIALTLLQSAR